MLQDKNSSMPVLAWIGVLTLALSPKRLWRFNQRLQRSCLALVLLACSLISISGCSSSPSQPKDPGTPVGTQSITVAITDAASNASHSVTLQITVQ
jgi:hypothetical protein